MARSRFIRRDRLSGRIDTVLLFGALVANTLYQSELGLEGSIWNTVTFALCALFVARQLRYLGTAMLVFMVPVIIVVASMLINVAELSTSGIRSALATSLGFALFAVPGIQLDRALMRSLVIFYIVVCIGLSIWFFPTDGEFLANANFNVNPNAAAHLFFLLSALSLFFLNGRIKWVLVFGFGVLLVTTQARSATLAAGLMAYWYWVASKRDSLSVPQILWRTVLVAVPAVLAIVLIQLLIPEYFAALVGRLETTRDDGSLSGNRSYIWARGVELSVSSWRSMVVGAGPARAAELIGSGAHSSYIDGLVAFGYIFVVSSVVAIVWWTRWLTRKGHKQIFALTIPLMLAGATETFLFYGISMLWFLPVFIGQWLQSGELEPEPVAAGPARAAARARRGPPVIRTLAGAAEDADAR